MILEFNDEIAAFILKAPDLNYVDKNLSDKYSGEIGDNVLVNRNREIILYSYAFADDAVKELELEIGYLVNQNKKIKGKYTVPQLNLKDVSFKEVLEAIRHYYRQKLAP